MTIALRYAAHSDVGCLREGNEDSAYAGPHLLAVADGMGGHAGGEIASAIAISALRPLDEDVPHAEDVSTSLQQAVEQANSTLAQRVRDEPWLENMGTTLTALLWTGSRMVMIHIGDSRAYLLREGEFSQITHDHTLVQTLVDEGKITEEEVATHPQRSLLLRALDGRSEVDPDISVSEAKVGDRFLLCSDGLSGVVSESTIHETLATETNVEATARRLIDLANRGGGPDNITAVVADIVDTTNEPPPENEAAVAGAADQRDEPAMTPDTPAGRAQGLNRGSGDTAEMQRMPSDDPPESSEDSKDSTQPRTRRWWPMVVTFLAAAVVLVGAGYYFGTRYLDSQYFIGPSEDGENVAIHQGIDSDVAGYSLSEQVEDTGVALDMLPENERKSVDETIPADSEENASERVEELRAKAEECERDPESCGRGEQDADRNEPSADGEEQSPADEHEPRSLPADSAGGRP
ncbi:protein phosphatase [Haloactinospora alba]|uniref:Serine/threonine protein phosphatase PstP n=1 Tax=Haloactinospora alba TaxID=405555 RepID=A0A543N9Z4_9ACTN|nr:Stp1/IreP family PP2C-type Ser/Thr phosphatase [Haloactinospora alba]TQN28640.1 protein phosphatase [Haloactinospora alba]